MIKNNNKSKFGPVYTQFERMPVDAINFLIKKKDGECIKALYRSDIGYINIVWGEVTDPIKHKGFGLSHIIDKHGKDIEKLGFDIASFIFIIVQYGVMNIKKSETHKKVFESSEFRFVVAIEEDDNKQWLLTAFNLLKKPKK